MAFTLAFWGAMNLDNVTVELRPRAEWEAADLGARMVRRDARTIYASWFAITLPLYLLACLAIWFGPAPGWIAIGYWWLEPITDGAILHIISRRLFGENVGVMATLREVPRLARKNIIFLLPPYRFHFARSVAMPVTQLEGLTGERRRARATVLNSRIMNFGTGVTAAYQHLFLAIYVGVLLIIFAMIPAAYQGSLGMDWFDNVYADDPSRIAYIVQLSFLYVAQTALHPWFVGAGFGLYINCRTRLEAWDIEVSFRRMINRRSLAAILVFLFLLPVTIPGNALAEDYEKDYDQQKNPAGEPNYVDDGFAGFWGNDEVSSALTTVFEMDQLSTEEEVTSWRSKSPAPEPAEVDPGNFDYGFFRSLGLVLSLLAEIWLWVLVGLFVLALYKTRDIWMPYLDPGPARERSTRVVLSSGEITAEHLPDDIPAEVRRLWNGGDKREALSLLFRGNVFNMVTKHGVRVPPSATEGACVDAVKQHSDPGLATYFESVVLAWVLFAYGSRAPEDAALQSLCDEWTKHYGP